MRFTVYNAADAAAVYGAQARADKLDLAVLELANEGYRILKGGAISAQGSPNLTVALAAGVDRNNGREVWYAAQNSAAVTAPAAGNDKFILVEVDSLGVLKVDNTTTGVVTGATARPVPTAGRVVHGLIYIANSTLTDIDGTNTAGHGKIQDLGVLAPEHPRGSEMLQRWAEWYEEFLSDSVTTGQIGSHGWNTAASGAGAGLSAGADAGVSGQIMGVLTLATGTTTTGWAWLALGATQRLYGGPPLDFIFETRVVLGNLSTSGQEYIALIGLHGNQTNGATEPSTGIYFKYDRLGLGANWQCVIANNGTRTTIDSGIAVTTNMVRLRAVHDATAAKVRFFIDDVEVSSSPVATTNLPGFFRYFTPSINIGKSAGTTSRTLQVDYFYNAAAVVR